MKLRSIYVCNKALLWVKTHFDCLGLAPKWVGLSLQHDAATTMLHRRDGARFTPDFNVIKTKEMIVDYRKKRNEHAPILIDGAVVEQVESFKFLGVHITNKLTWSKHTKTTKPITPQETVKIWQWSSDPQKVLQLVASLPGRATAW